MFFSEAKLLANLQGIAFYAQTSGSTFAEFYVVKKDDKELEYCDTILCLQGCDIDVYFAESLRALLNDTYAKALICNDDGVYEFFSERYDVFSRRKSSLVTDDHECVIQAKTVRSAKSIADVLNEVLSLATS